MNFLRVSKCECLISSFKIETFGTRFDFQPCRFNNEFIPPNH